MIKISKLEKLLNGIISFLEDQQKLNWKVEERLKILENKKGEN